MRPNHGIDSDTLRAALHTLARARHRGRRAPYALRAPTAGYLQIERFWAEQEQ